MNILISGGAGFIGSRTALALLSRGNRVTILDNLSPQIHGSNPNWPPNLVGRCRLIRGDVRNPEDWRSALEGVDVVLHFAAETGTGQSMYAATRYCDVNVSGTAALADVVVNDHLPVRRILLASSRAVYGEGPYATADGEVIYPGTRDIQSLRRGDFNPNAGQSTPSPIPASEEATATPTSVYGATKLAQEQLLTVVCGPLQIPLSILRYQNVYGPGQSLHNPYTGILAVFSSLCRSNKTLDIYEDGLCTRDFVFVDDVVRANLLAIDTDLPGTNTFNIGTGVATTLLDIVTAFGHYLDANIPYEVSGHFRPGDIRHASADISKARRLIGYRPQVSFEEGVAAFLDWAFLEPVCDSGAYERSVQQIQEAFGNRK